MRIVFAAGGSGGHIFPAISAAEELRRRFQQTEIVFFGRPHSLEEKVVTAAGYQFEALRSAPLPKSSGLQIPAFVVKSIAGISSTFFLLRKLRPRIVVGFGGYVSAPAVVSAAVLKIPILLHEQNLIPGRATRYLARFAWRIALSFPETKKYLRKSLSTVVTGNPIRASILQVTREEGLKRFNFRPGQFTILVIGGSRGARLLNTITAEVFSNLEKEQRLQFQIIHLTGEGECAGVSSDYRRLGIESRVFPFLEDIVFAYACCDLVLSRAGATAIAEITGRGLPAILIPYRYAGRHQRENARWMEKSGACLVLEEDGLSEAKLRNGIIRMASDAETRRRMGRVSKSLGRPEAAEKLIEEILRLADSGERWKII